jgi:hypothetical protein
MEEPTIRTVLLGLAASQGPLSAVANACEETLDVRPGGTLYVDLDRGAVEVTSHEANQVRIEAYASGWTSWAFDFDLAREGNDIRLTGETLGWRFWPFGPRVHVRAWVPREYSAEVQTRGGRVTLTALTGRVVAETSGGAVTALRVTGAVELRTSGGAIRVGHVHGDLSVETSGGAIDIGDVTGDIDAETSGGAIEIVNASGRVEARTSGGRINIVAASGEVEATTSGGPIFASFTGAPGGRLKTSGGAIEIRFPASAGASLDAETSGGHVHIDDRLTVRGECSPHRVVGAINDGGAPLLVRTSGGSISLSIA